MSGLSSEADVIQYEGKWLTQIPHEEAFRIRCDVQLYGRYKSSSSAQIHKDTFGPTEYVERATESLSSANDVHSWWWTDYLWYIEVGDPTKPEYVSDEETC